MLFSFSGLHAIGIFDTSVEILVKILNALTGGQQFALIIFPSALPFPVVTITTVAQSSGWIAFCRLKTN